MKKKKKKSLMSVSVLIIFLFMSTLSPNSINTKAMIDDKYNHYNFDSSDSISEVISTGSNSNSKGPVIKVDSSGNIHVIWYDATNYASSGTDADIIYRKWADFSSAWTSIEVISTESTSDSYDPYFTVDSQDNIHVVWEDSTNYASSGTDSDIFYKQWDAQSSSWTTTEVVSTESTSTSRETSVAFDSSGNAHVIWRDETDYNGAGTDQDIFYKMRDNLTSSWSTTEVVSTESTTYSWEPIIDVDSNDNIHIIWSDLTDYNGCGTDYDLFYKKYDAISSSWESAEVVSTQSSSDSTRPSLDIDPDENIHVVWRDATNYASSGTDQDIFYKYLDALSSSWSTTEVVSTESTSHSENPSIAIDSAGSVHVTWQDLTDYYVCGTDVDIFYKYLDVLSSSWTTTVVVSSESSGNSAENNNDVDSAGNVHVVWEDWTNYDSSGTDLDIFYKKIINELPSPPELAFIVPNPDEDGIINLIWNNLFGTIAYYVYRSTSYIWSVEGLVPLKTVFSNTYEDNISINGFYYYVIIAENLIGNSTISNCQYVEVNILELEVPELSPILPNPTEISSVSLLWNSIDGATEYYIYRTNSYIWSVEGLAPITTVVTNSYVDSLPSEGIFFYVIVAGDGVRNSTHSNCEYIEYELPSLNEFVIVSSLFIATFVFMFVVTRIRKKKSKQN